METQERHPDTQPETPTPEDLGPDPEEGPVPVSKEPEAPAADIDGDPGPEPDVPPPDDPPVEDEHSLADQLIDLQERHRKLVLQLQSQNILAKTYED